MPQCLLLDIESFAHATCQSSVGSVDPIRVGEAIVRGINEVKSYLGPKALRN